MKEFWTSEQDIILIDKFSNTSTKEIAILVNKTPKQVGRRAAYLKIYKTKEFISKQKSKIATKNRKCRLCNKKHESLGLCHNHYELYRRGTITLDGIGDYVTVTHWGKEELQILIENYSNSTLNDLRKLLPKHNKQSILNKSHRLKLKKSKEGWKKCHKEKITEVSKVKNSCSQRGIDVKDFDGFSTTFNFRLRQTDEYNHWRKQVYERDKFICQKCGKIGNGDLHAHHIIHLSQLIKDFPYEQNKKIFHHPYFYDIDNGITLCENCHAEIHNNIGLTSFKK